jgi:hypothetical protein
MVFAMGHLRCVDDLMLLEAVARESDRWWDATSAGEELLLGEAAARIVLDHLATHNLLEIRVTGDVRYRFRPGTAALRDAALACVGLYRADPKRLLSVFPRRGRRAHL